MENNELFQTIEKLKKTLSDIVSARQQVAETIAAYDNTNTRINSYIENFERIEVAISSIIELLSQSNIAIEQQSTAVLDEFRQSSSSIVGIVKKELTTSSKQFDVNVNRSIVALTAQIESLDTVIKKAALENIEKLLLELKQSLVAQGQNFDKFSNLTR